MEKCRAWVMVEPRKVVLEEFEIPKVAEDCALLKELINHRQILTNKFGAENYGFITMWHVLNLHLDSIYYINDEDVIIIKQEKNDTVHILDVIFRQQFDLELAMLKIIESDSIKSIKYYFPPDRLNYKYDKVKKEDTGLFILSDLELGDNPFRFPMTAIT